jgi:plasmid stabilization system protein ParE
MKTYRLTPAAEDDLFQIWVYIARDDVIPADQLEAEFFDAFQRLAERPDLGHFRGDLTGKPVRFFTVRGTFLVVYDPARDPIAIIRVLHGSRDAVAELEREG